MWTLIIICHIDRIPPTLCFIFPLTTTEVFPVCASFSRWEWWSEIGHGRQDVQGEIELRMGEETWEAWWVLRIVSELQVPRSSSNEEVMFLTIRVKGATQEFKKRTTVLIKNEDSLIFVQTDKPVYKPGQTGKKGPKLGHWKGRIFPLPLNSLKFLLPWYLKNLPHPWPVKESWVLIESFSISVKFRIVSLDENLRPLNELVSLQLFT